MFGRRKRYGKSIGDLKGYAEGLYVMGLPKSEIKLKSSVFPSERTENPNMGKNMSDIMSFWSKDGCKMDQKLYDMVLKAKMI